MNKEELFSNVGERYRDLKSALSGDNIALIKDLSMEVHALVHPFEVSGCSVKTIADYVLNYVEDGHQNLFVPREDCQIDLRYAGSEKVPMWWQFWHTYRIEDLVSNILIANQAQIFDDEWKRKIGMRITDTGNALEFDELKSLSQEIKWEGLRDYMMVVGKNTRQILSGLTLEQVKARAPIKAAMRILEEGGVTTDFRSVWLLVYWSRLTVGEMLLTPITDHHMMHLAPCIHSVL